MTRALGAHKIKNLRLSFFSSLLLGINSYKVKDRSMLQPTHIQYSYNILREHALKKMGIDPRINFPKTFDRFTKKITSLLLFL